MARLAAWLAPWLALAVLSAAMARAEHWAVIVVGSRGYENYRHQADACHAYHVARRHGVPRENVVLMMYDDVATAKENPLPGQLFNRPSPSRGSAAGSATEEDVYKDCHVDYRGEQVTPANFLHVLRGNATAVNGSKVLASGPEDRVFVNFVDHGARGFVVFPHGQMLTSSQLTSALEAMHGQKQYKELVFYVEACHSGSMFWSWSMSHINAFVTTAANGWESSWGTYCPPMDKVRGVSLGTCLGDLYSVSWMEDSDKTDLSAESLEQQFQLVKRETSKKSHAQQFGSSRVRKEIVGDFLSNYDLEGTPLEAEEAQARSRSTSAVDAHDIPLVLAFYKYLRSSTGPARSASALQLIETIQERERADELFAAIHGVFKESFGEELQPVAMSGPRAVTPCDDQVFESFGRLMEAVDGGSPQASDMPRGFTSYSLQYAGVLTDLCARLESLEAVEAVLRCAMQPQSCHANDSPGSPTQTQ